MLSELPSFSASKNSESHSFQISIFWTYDDDDDDDDDLLEFVTNKSSGVSYLSMFTVTKKSIDTKYGTGPIHYYNDKFAGR
jgi:hypothetical protein